MASNVKVGINAAVQVGGVALVNSDWDLKRTAVVAEAHNTVDGTLRASGRKDASGSVNGFRDATVPIEGQVVEGGTYALKLFTDATKFFLMTAIISNLDIKAALDEVESWSFDYQLQSGVITNPV